MVTPSLNILEGVTRKRVLTIASERMPVECRPVSVDELFTAAEIFVSSTTKRISPVVEINGHKIGNGKPGRVTSELFHALIAEEASN